MIDKKKLSDAIKNSKDNPQKPPVDPNLTLDVKNEKLEEFFNYIRNKIKVIGHDIEIKSKEKSSPSCKEKR